MNELARVEKWLYTYLSADATLSAGVGTRFYGPKAKTGTLFPYITWNWQGATDTNGNAAARLLNRALYQVKVVNKGGLNDTVAGIADRLDDLLKDVRAVTFNDVQISSRRTGSISYVEPGPDPETNFLHFGGIYSINVAAI